MQLKGKQPSWNRIGRRFVGDIAVKRFPSYSVIGIDKSGHTWEQVVTDYTYLNSSAMRKWWYSNTPPAGKPFPNYPGAGA